jgi:hypothetical protein
MERRTLCPKRLQGTEAKRSKWDTVNVGMEDEE